MDDQAGTNTLVGTMAAGSSLTVNMASIASLVPANATSLALSVII